jgi:hypothetical protein
MMELTRELKLDVAVVSWRYLMEVGLLQNLGVQVE